MRAAKAQQGIANEGFAKTRQGEGQTQCGTYL